MLLKPRFIEGHRVFCASIKDLQKTENKIMKQYIKLKKKKN